MRRYFCMLCYHARAPHPALLRNKPSWPRAACQGRPVICTDCTDFGVSFRVELPGSTRIASHAIPQLVTALPYRI